MTLPFGIDISKHQGVNDYAKMKANAAFVFVKATESWGYVDPKFVSNWQGLAGHRRGAYVYVYLSEDPLRQANHLIDTVTRVGVDWRYDRLVLDLEKSGHGLSKAEVARRVLIMMERIKEVTGRYPILYSRASWVNDNMLVTDPRIANADWWLAHYLTHRPYPLYTPEKASPPTLPRGVSSWLIHQTGERGNGKAHGVASYYVDQNRWNTDNQEISAFFGNTEEEPPVVIPPEIEPPVEEKPLYEAVVITDPPNRLRTRFTPAGTIRPEVDWYQSADKVDVLQESDAWSRTGIKKWAMSSYLQRLMYLPLFNLQLWSQRDPRWGKDKMGSSNILMEQEGCLSTATATVLHFLGIDTDPKRYNYLLSTRGGYQAPNYMYWLMPDILWPGQVARAEYQWFNYGKGWESLADSILSSGRPVLAQVDFVPGGLMQQHWVTLPGKIDNLFYCLDPWFGTLGALSARYDKVFRLASYERL